MRIKSNDRINVYPADLKCDGLKDPVGITMDRISFSWKIRGEAKNVIQEAVVLQVSSEADSEYPLCL